jgi:transglutaminase-like putative cysteine protease
MIRKSWRWTLVLLAVALLGAVGDDAWREPARYLFEYDVEPPDLGTGPPARVRMWIPYPAETADQRVLSAKIDSPWPWRVTRDAFGNRSVYVEGQGRPSAPIRMRFEIERRPSNGVRLGAIAAGTSLDPELYRRANRLIPLDGMIRAIAEQESKGHVSDADKIRAFYDYVVRSMRYNKDGTGWGRGDAVWACTNKRGNCTDFHSLLIGMARSEGIPARFIIGFPIPQGPGGTIPGYHCWAEVYEAKRGWVPIDASEAKKTGRIEAYFGSIPNNRVQFTTGRDLVLEPPQQGPPLNYFIYPYAEADGKPVKDVPAVFRFERRSAGKS